MRESNPTQYVHVPPPTNRQGSPVETAPTPTPAQAAPRPALLHEVFARTAHAHPHALAIDVPPGPRRPERERLTYAEVERRVASLAARLSPFVRGESVIAIALPRDAAAIYVAQLAVMRAGAAYTCFAPDLAADRARYLLEDSAAVAVIARETDRARIEALGVPADRIADVADGPAARGAAPRANGHRPAWAPSPSSLAYVIYTSGTSGRPKGVMIEHRNILTLVESDRDYFGLGVGDRVAQSSSCAYDSSVEEIWLAFGCGATLVLMDDDAVRLGPDLVDWLRRERVTVFCPPPTLLRMAACDDPATALPELRLLYVGGEELPDDVAARWAPGRRLENGYGPTECSVTVVRTPVRSGDPVTIGWPVQGNRAWVLDEALEPVERGTAGELCIAGPSVARGYLNQPALTAERFVMHPRYGRLYRTGDLVVHDAAGSLIYLGRSDSQVKIRGHRVELSAIEAHLCACDGVQAAACALQGEAPMRELAAFLVADAARPADLAAVRARMRDALPEHMQPARYAFVDELPTRDASGKLDRSALPDLVRLARRAGGHARVRAGLRRSGRAGGGRAFAAHLPAASAIGPDDDFFLDLGGNSLLAAQVISTLRADPRRLRSRCATCTKRARCGARGARARSHRPRRRNRPSPRWRGRGCAAWRPSGRWCSWRGWRSPSYRARRRPTRPCSWRCRR